MTTSLSSGGDQATVYTTLGQVLRVPLPAPAPERQLVRWLARQAAANPAFPLRVRSVLLRVSQPLCPDCRRTLDQALHRWNLAGRLRVAVAQPATAAPACGCAAAPPAYTAVPPPYDADADDNDEPFAEEELSYMVAPEEGKKRPRSAAPKTAGRPATPKLPAAVLFPSVVMRPAGSATFALEKANTSMPLSWKTGVYVLKKNRVPFYVGISGSGKGEVGVLGTRINQHALCLRHFKIDLTPYTVEVFNYPDGKEIVEDESKVFKIKKILVLESIYTDALDGAMVNGEKVSLTNQKKHVLDKQGELGELGGPAMLGELGELAQEYEGLFDRFRRLFQQNPVKAAVFKGLMDASNPLPAKDAALADHQQNVVEARVADAQRPPTQRADNRPPAAWQGPPPRPDWQHPANIYGARVPPPRVRVPTAAGR